MTNHVPLILIVDDEDGIRELIKIGLMKSQCRVLEANDGASAMEVIRGDSIDAVISDLFMPKVSGLQLLALMRAEGYLTPFILMTAYEAEDYTIKARSLGAFDVLKKPFEINQIATLVLAAIERDTQYLRGT